jgi:hypothetical protein
LCLFTFRYFCFSCHISVHFCLSFFCFILCKFKVAGGIRKRTWSG